MAVRIDPGPGVFWFRGRDGIVVQAARWESERVTYAAAVVGWLLAAGIDFRCERGPDPNLLLVLRGLAGGVPVASGGDFVARRGATWTVIPGEFAAAVLTPMSP